DGLGMRIRKNPSGRFYTGGTEDCFRYLFVLREVSHSSENRNISFVTEENFSAVLQFEKIETVLLYEFYRHTELESLFNERFEASMFDVLYVFLYIHYHNYPCYLFISIKNFRRCFFPTIILYFKPERSMTETFAGKETVSMTRVTSRTAR